MGRTPAVSTTLSASGTSIFAEMSALASRHGAINLGQGFPDFEGPEFIKEAAIRAIRDGANQYARSQGQPELVAAVAAKVKRQYGLDRCPQTEVGVYSGATEGIAAGIFGILNPGDEVITFEPVYDSYLPLIRLVGAVPRIASLKWPDFRMNLDAVRSLFNAKTRLLLLNTPHNPTGTVFSNKELTELAALCIEHDVLVLTDEVYEHLTFEGAQHVPMATLPGMADRVLSLSSTGKTFSMTGWKIGYAHGPSELVAAAQSAHQFLTFATATPFQIAMAEALAVGEDFYEAFQADYAARRTTLVQGLEAAGFPVCRPEGTYFAMAHIGHLGFSDDRRFAYWLTEEMGVTCIPASPFYVDHDEQAVVRFAFCKEVETLQAAMDRLSSLANRRQL